MSADDITTLIVLFLLFGGGEVVIRVFRPMLDGRKTIARLKAENKALRRDVERSDLFAQRMVDSSGVTVVTNPRHEALLWRVQATDTALPQLPKGLRNDIDTVLAQTSSIEKGKS